jgi:hypothetical protein
MNRKILAGIAAGLLTTAVLVSVGVGAYRAGERSDRSVEVVGEVVTNGEGTTRTVLVPSGDYGWNGGWNGGWHGPGPGFVLFPLIVIGLILLFATRRGGWHGPHRYHGDHWRDDDELREWHRREHEPTTPAT